MLKLNLEKKELENLKEVLKNDICEKVQNVRDDLGICEVQEKIYLLNALFNATKEVTVDVSNNKWEVVE